MLLSTHPGMPGVDGCQIVMICTVAALVQEVMMYLLMYRRSAFKNIKNTVLKQQKKLEDLRAKEAFASASKGSKDKRKKKEERLEALLKKDIMTSLGPQRMQASIMVWVVSQPSRCTHLHLTDGADDVCLVQPDQQSVRCLSTCDDTCNGAHVIRFAGVPVATLPFHPFPFIHKVSHRGLEGDDFSQCSVVRLVMLPTKLPRTPPRLSFTCSAKWASAPW